MTAADLTPDLTPYTDTTYQVWVFIPTGAAYMYRDGLIHSVARHWAAGWNARPPADVPPGSTFGAVTAVTTFTVVAR